jgi:hypothetical protein
MLKVLLHLAPVPCLPQQIVTNYHVLQSALAKFGASPNAPMSSSAPNPAVGKKVALVTIEVCV